MKNLRFIFTHRFFVLIVFAGIVMASCFVSNAQAITAQETEHNKIAYLLDVIGSSNLIFIRNGVEYNGADARAHLEEKMQYVGDNIHTVEDFINDIASESSVTGISYYVRLADGTEVESKAWLHQQLAKMKE